MNEEPSPADASTCLILTSGLISNKFQVSYKWELCLSVLCRGRYLVISFHQFHQKEALALREEGLLLLLNFIVLR